MKNKLKIGDEVFFANFWYEVADVTTFQHMIGIYDEPKHSRHIDYINFSSVKKIKHK